MEIKRYVRWVVTPADIAHKGAEGVDVEFSEEKAVTWKDKTGKPKTVQCPLFCGALDGEYFEITVFPSKLSPRGNSLNLEIGKHYKLSYKNDNCFWVE